jgi:dihydroxyacid dehydratase/phosphogluconate dehydratase
MEDLHEAGGVPAVMKYLLKQGIVAWRLFNGNQTLAENFSCCSRFE